MHLFFDETTRHIHILGIGGISMSAIARILHNQGYHITGSDSQEGKELEVLRREGITVFHGHAPSQVEGADLILHTSAIHEDNPEYAEAVRRGIPVMNRGQFMGRLTASYQNSIAIAGTHGKTTTTSMAGVMLAKSDLAPTVLVGAHVKELGGNALIGKGSCIVNEACEYYQSFLDFNYNTAVILNIDFDHVDYFPDLEAVKKSFLLFANHTQEGGVVILNGDDDNIRSILPHIKHPTLLCSARDMSDYSAQNITFEEGFPRFELWKKDHFLQEIRLSIAGDHAVMDALCAIAAVDQILPVEHLLSALEPFQGADRRMQERGRIQGTLLLEDYAHHPTEIRATMKALRRRYPDQKLIITFQPHTFSRTKKLFDLFLDAFAEADDLMLVDIYAAREQNTFSISSEDLAHAICEKGYRARYVSSLEEAAREARTQFSEGVIYVAMGAGSIHQIFDFL